jgi:hypothetical protein
MLKKKKMASLLSLCIMHFINGNKHFKHQTKNTLIMGTTIFSLFFINTITALLMNESQYTIASNNFSEQDKHFRLASSLHINLATRYAG